MESTTCNQLLLGINVLRTASGRLSALRNVCSLQAHLLAHARQLLHFTKCKACFGQIGIFVLVVIEENISFKF